MKLQSTLINRYQIEHELGQGGMGTVYLAKDLLSDNTVAVKHLKSEVATPELIERFRREGEALRDLNHPNIVKLLDTVEADSEYYLVLEYVSGGDLADLIRHGVPDYQRILRYALDLADALTRAHKLDIIHRDLKPANILIADDGTLRLTDFGIAQLGSKERVTDTDAVVGTIDYLPPEAFDGEGIDTRSDIWAFGVILFELIAGEHPFSGASLTDTLHNILVRLIPDLEALKPDVPIALIDLVYRMLERDPNNRIPSVRHIGAELEDILHGRSVQQPITKRFESDSQKWSIEMRHNLPAQTTAFIGREADVQALVDLLSLADNRLITILGPGGMGKTRLSLAVGEAMLTQYPDGVFFVELAPLSDANNIVTAIAEAMDFQLQLDEQTPQQQIQDFLASRTLLLVMDNYEHLIDGASLTTQLLKDAPNLNILVTSRQRLNQMGETIFDLIGLDFPEWETPADAQEFGAVQLFLQSAKRGRPDFELTADNLDAVTQICKLVRGMPLGIVLAASWLGVLSPDEIATELMTGFDVLETTATDLPERQRSIRAVFDYSWDHLTKDEQAVFMKLSLFRGGFTRESAERVAGATLRVLMALMNKSLIRRDNTNGRYEIHELLRQYAYQQLDSHQLIAETQQALVACFLALSRDAEKELRYANQEYWFKLIEDELDNIREVLSWSLTHDVSIGVEIAINIRDFWFYQGYHVEAHSWFNRFHVQQDNLNPVLRSRLLGGMSVIAWALQQIDEAERLAREAVAIMEARSETKHKAWAYAMLATATSTQEGKYEEALSVCQIAEDLFASINDRAGLAQIYNIEGNAHEFAERYDLAIELFNKSRAIGEETGERRRVAINLGNVARLNVEFGDYVEGLAMLSKAMKLDYEIGFQYMLLFDLHDFGALLTKLKRYEDAVVMMGVGNKLREKLNTKIQPADQVGVDRTLSEIHNHLDETQFRVAWQRGQEMTFHEAMDYALRLEVT